MRAPWQFDWTIFCECVAADLNGGLGPTEMTQKYGGHEVTWQGVVAEIKLGCKHLPGVRLVMSSVPLSLTNGQLLHVDHLHLVVPPDLVSSWAGSALGDKVRFSAALSSGNGPFSGISVGTYGTDSDAWLEVGTRRARRVA